MTSSAVLKEKGKFTPSRVSLTKTLLHNDCIDEKTFSAFLSLEPIQSEKERNWNLALHAPKMLNVTLPLIVMWKI